MTTYNIRTTSWPVWILTLIVSLIVGGFLIAAMGIRNYSIVMILMIIILFTSFYLQRFTSRGQVQILMTDTTFQIKYLNQSIFSKESDRNITLSNIESYKYQPDRNFDLFKLTLKDKNEIHIWHYSGFADDDFEKLILEFPNITLDYNNHKENISTNKSASEETKLVKIKREKTLYEGKIGLFLAGLAIIFIALFIYLIATNKLKNSSGIFGLLASISGAIFFLGQFFKYRKEEK